MSKDRQISESFRLSAILSFSGGLQDAYTYNVRGNVFANAQTGNQHFSITFMCHAGTFVSKGSWIWLCKHNVHRKFAKRDRKPFAVFQN